MPGHGSTSADSLIANACEQSELDQVGICCKPNNFVSVRLAKYYK